MAYTRITRPWIQTMQAAGSHQSGRDHRRDIRYLLIEESHVAIVYRSPLVNCCLRGADHRAHVEGPIRHPYIDTEIILVGREFNCEPSRR